MNTFLVIAAVMAAVAAAAVALPLLRDRQSRVLGAVVAVLVAAAAAGLYPLWSNWNWRAPADTAAAGAGAPDVAAMVAKLEQRLHDHPDDLAGWLLLGRSYLALNRLDDGVLAYDHARQLDGKNADAAMGLGEAMSLKAGGEITPQAAQLFEQALVLSPGNPKALLYGGFAAAVRGDRALARSRWLALKELHPPQRIEQMLDVRIAELGADGSPAPAPGGGALGAQAAGIVPGAAPAGTSASPAGTSASGGGLSAALVTVTISLAPALKSRLLSEAPLFVFAREPGSRGPPLAAKRLSSSAIGTQVSLSPADSMMPGRVLTGGQRVSVTARVSFSGQPVPAAGDLYGELSYEVGRDGVRNLVIDRVAE
jgi:cytochrome c-type biogenesis protein CcmH